VNVVVVTIFMVILVLSVVMFIEFHQKHTAQIFSGVAFQVFSGLVDSRDTTGADA
jgi:hypothetical protein